MLRVLITARAQTQVGGVVSYVELLLANLSSDITVDRFVVGARTDRTSFVGRAIITLRDMVRLLRVRVAEEYECVHLNPSMNFKAITRDGGILLLLWASGARRFLVFLHGWDQPFADKVANNLVWRRLFRFTFGKADQIVVLGTRFKRELSSIGLEPKKISVKSTMFDGTIFQAVEPREDSAKLRVIFLSRMTKEKGIRELLEGFQLVAAQGAAVELVVAGDGPELPGARRWVHGQHLTAQVSFAGFVSGHTKAQLLTSGDIFAFPTYHGEGCPISLLEAMAAGMAVITTKVGGIADVVVSGENGILLESVSARALAEALGRLISDRRDLRRIGALNKRQAWAKYEARVVTREIEDTYRNMGR